MYYLSLLFIFNLGCSYFVLFSQNLIAVEYRFGLLSVSNFECYIQGNNFLFLYRISLWRGRNFHGTVQVMNWAPQSRDNQTGASWSIKEISGRAKLLIWWERRYIFGDLSEQLWATLSLVVVAVKTSPNSASPLPSASFRLKTSPTIPSEFFIRTSRYIGLAKVK